MKGMKRSQIFMGFLLWGLVTLPSLGALVLSRFGYRFELLRVPVCVLLTDALALWLAVRPGGEGGGSRAGRVLFASLAILSLVWGLLCLGAETTVPVLLGAAVGIAACAALTVRYGAPKSLRTASLLLFGLLVLPAGLFSLLGLAFGGFGQETVVRTVESPVGTRYAQVLRRNEGALGGSTYVDVRGRGELNLGLFRIFPEPRRVYDGGWGDADGLDIRWEDEDTLRINRVPYDL